MARLTEGSGRDREADLRSHPASGLASRPISGIARTDRRTKELVKRLQPGDIAVIDHADLDRVAAEGLVEARVAAVINASASITGRYPNVGPLLLAAAGIVVVDGVGPRTLQLVPDGAAVRIDGAHILVRERIVAEGNRQTLHTLDEQVEQEIGRAHV